MTKAQLIAYINAWIKDNSNKEITAAIMRDVLDKIVQFIDDNVGEIQDLVEGETVIGAINLLFQMFEDFDLVHPVNKFEGTDNPNNVPPLGYNVGDLYVRNGNQLFQYNGSSWIRVIDYNTDFDGKLDRGTFEGDADDIISMIPTGLNLNDYQKRDEKGIANGYAGLGADGLVPMSQLPFKEELLKGAAKIVLTSTGAQTLNFNTHAHGHFNLTGEGYLTITHPALAVGETVVRSFKVKNNGFAFDLPTRISDKMDDVIDVDMENTITINYVQLATGNLDITVFIHKI